MLLLAAAAAGGPAELLTGFRRTEHFEVFYRPGSRAGASAPRVAVVAERELARICAALDVPNDGHYRLFLYDDVPELHAITGTEGNAGFSSGDVSHLPHDNDQTRFHEMVHLVAVRLPKAGDEPRNLFFAEGLANALLEFVHGVHVHDVAAFYRRRKELPPLATLTEVTDFYAWLAKRPKFDAYDVGASWFRHLLDAHGAEKVKRYYGGAPARDAFGVELRELEGAWHAMLDAREPAPEVETLLRGRAGEEVAFDVFELDPDRRLPAELLGQPGDWKDLGDAALRPDDKESWSREGAAIRGRSGTPAWSWCELGTRKYDGCAVRARIRAEPGTLGVQLRLGGACQAMLVGNGTFLFGGDRCAASHPEPRIRWGREIDFLLVRRKSTVQVWIDGFLALEHRHASGAAPVGLGVALGQAAFTDVRVRVLR